MPIAIDTALNTTINLPTTKKSSCSFNLFLRLLLPSLNDGITNEELGKGSSPTRPPQATPTLARAARVVWLSVIVG